MLLCVSKLSEMAEISCARSVQPVQTFTFYKLLYLLIFYLLKMRKRPKMRDAKFITQ